MAFKMNITLKSESLGFLPIILHIENITSFMQQDTFSTVKIIRNNSMYITKLENIGYKYIHSPNDHVPLGVLTIFCIHDVIF